MAEVLTYENNQPVELWDTIASGAATLVYSIEGRVVKIIAGPQGSLIHQFMKLHQRSNKIWTVKSFLQDELSAFQQVWYGIPEIESIDGWAGFFHGMECFYYFQPRFTILDEEPDFSAHPFIGHADRPVMLITETGTGPRKVLLDWNLIIFRSLMFLKQHSYGDMLRAIRERLPVEEHHFT